VSFFGVTGRARRKTGTTHDEMLIPLCEALMV